jgi:glycosyltransferase involved in cell wall biosynthesis
MQDKIIVTFFQRKPLPIHKSLEYIFEDVRNRMPDYIDCVTKVFRYFSRGIFRRLYIMWEAYKFQGDVNHITGDIHFAAILLQRKKTMLTVHDCGMLLRPDKVKRWFLQFFWFTLPLRKCALVTVVSEATKNELIKFTGYPADRVHVIPVAISPLFRYSPKKFDSTAPIILQVGATVNKNLERLIEALAGISCRFNIIGYLSESVKDLLKTNNIAYSNYTNLTVNEVVEQYVQADLVSFVSTYEGFGMPIVEANATGRPVITSNILSMPEVAGNAACLVDPFNVKDIRTGFLRLINDEPYRMQLIENGLVNCRRFDPQRIADSYLDLYLQLSGKKEMV